MTWHSDVINRLDHLSEIKDTKESKLFVLQKVNDGLSFANSSRLLLNSPSAADLNGDSTLDYIEQANISQVTETKLIDETWVSPEYNFDIQNSGRGTVGIGIMNSSINSSINLDTVIFQLGKITSNGSFTSSHNFSAEFDYNTNATGLQYISSSVPFENLSIICDANNHFAIKTQVYAHVNNSDVLGTLRLRTSRGAYDSYVNMEINPR